MPGGAQSQRQLIALTPAGARCRLSCGDDPKDLRLQNRALIAAIDRRYPERPGPGDRLENTRLHGGHTDAGNHPGGGAAFTARLPLSPARRRRGTGALPFVTRS